MLTLPMKERYAHSISKDHIKLMLEQYKPKVIVELGAQNCSDTKDFLSWMEPEDKIFTVEADPRCYKKCQAIQDSRLTLIHAAITDRNGTGQFYLCTSVCPDMPEYGPFDAASTLYLPDDLNWHRFDEAVEVRYITLNTLFRENNISIADFVWCDVEGAVEQVIMGGSQTFHNIRYFYTEIYEHEIYKGQMLYPEMVKLFDDIGFDLVFKFQHDALFRNRMLTEKIEVI